ncbi:DUF4124 domain-containing protein [Acinetobacter rongchengensis]|uniref:DUF4124 domain-containing protein n=1 Tax=Acinetobacter rongchengensis TaxID=2419601 RepID=A0A3A8FCT5_9GAMM|nr:DUF4124 domain-containing protein [Acinetobacter rongchengensis]RKG38543.1 DUF4124 domain-containing protein [Acinetobacter rongchengensis]
MKASLMIFVFLGITITAEAGDVHKCVNKGTVTYQSRPCAGKVIPNPQQQYQKQLTQRTANQDVKQKAPDVSSRYSQQQHLQRKSGNGTSNEIPDTVEGKKKSMAIAQDAYKMTKDR